MKTDNTELMQDILKLTNLSSMEEDEKTMWKVLIPSMKKDELEKFKDILDREVTDMTDLYLKALKK